jgi:hypothetical protein
MKTGARARRILLVESVGFVALILLSWMDELLRLPRILFGDATLPNWHESAIESALIVVVWIVVFVLTKRMLKRFEDFTARINRCNYCRQLEQGFHRYASLEDYCEKELGVNITYGTCSTCGRKVSAEFPEVADSGMI